MLESHSSCLDDGWAQSAEMMMQALRSGREVVVVVTLMIHVDIYGESRRIIFLLLWCTTLQNGGFSSVVM